MSAIYNRESTNAQSPSPPATIAATGSPPHTSGFIQMADLRGRLTTALLATSDSLLLGTAPPLFLPPDITGNWFYATRAKKLDACTATLGGYACFTVFICSAGPLTLSQKSYVHHS